MKYPGILTPCQGIVAVSIVEASMRALAAETLGGRITPGIRGGMRFDHEVEKNRPLVEWVHAE